MHTDSQLSEQKLADHFTKLATDYLWQMVIADDQPEPTWLTHPAWQCDALDRVLASGLDPQDLSDLVREIQVQMIANFAQFLDYPQQLQELQTPAALSQSEGLEFVLQVQSSPQISWTPGGIYAALMRADPSRRYGESRSLVWRRWQQLDSAVQSELSELCHQQRYPYAARLWQQQTGETLSTALLAVKQLAQELLQHGSDD